MIFGSAASVGDRRSLPKEIIRAGGNDHTISHRRPVFYQRDDQGADVREMEACNQASEADKNISWPRWWPKNCDLRRR